MIEVYFEKNISGKENLKEFISEGHEKYNKKNRAVISYYDIDLISLSNYLLKRLGKRFNEKGYTTTILNRNHLDIFGLTNVESLWIASSIDFYWDETSNGNIPERFLEKIGEKDVKNWLRKTKRVPYFRRIPSVNAGGGFKTKKSKKELKPYLNILGEEGYEYELETKKDRLKQRIMNLESQLGSNYLDLGP